MIQMIRPGGRLLGMGDTPQSAHRGDGFSRHQRSWWIALIALALLLTPLGPALAADAHAKLKAELADPIKDGSGTIKLTFTVDDGFHAQSHTPLDESLIPLTVKMKDAAGVKFDDVKYPDPKVEDYPSLGKVSVYTGTVEIDVPFHGATPPVTLDGTLRFQACDSNSCFAPQKLRFEMKLDAAATPTTAPAATAPATQASADAAPPAKTTITQAGPTDHPIQILGHDLGHDAYFLAFGAAFVVGIIFNVMPCVLPVVPLKIMGFYEVSQHDRRKSIALGAVFSAGLIASFALLGVLIIALKWISWGGLFQKTWFTAIIVGVLVIMSFSMFGAFAVALPTGIYRFTPRHDTYSGNFLFGVLTAALSTPCTFGMFVGLLTWALSQPSIIGVGLIMTVGVGMASPYFVLSAFPEAARNFPRTGAWADVVKQMMGFLLLATAVYFAQPLFGHVSSDIFWWAMFAVIAAGGLFLIVRALQISSRLMPRLIAAAIAIFFVGPSLYGAIMLTSKPYEWVAYSADTVASARASGRPVLIDFTATWCNNCHYLEATVLKNRKIVEAVKSGGILMVKADVTDDNAPAAPLLQQINPANSIPVTAVYLPKSSTPKVLNGIYSVDDLIKAMGS